MKQFSFFPTVKDTKPSYEITADDLIKAIKGTCYKAEIDAIRSAPDKDTRSEWKARLPAVTASGEFSRRAASALIEHSGILVADLDLDDNPQLMDGAQMSECRARLVDDKQIHFLFESPSGGLKVGVKIQATDSETHKAAFLSVRDWFLDRHGLVIDNSCSDVSRLCFLSHDPEAWLREGSKVIATKVPRKSVLPIWQAQPVAAADGDSPGDQFNFRGDVEGMLQSQGWTTSNGKHWTRPGKSHGVSGTLGVVGERKFFCWTSGAAPLEANSSYSPFGLFAAFYHSGDFTAAAAALMDQGYGESAPLVSPEVEKSIAAMVANALKKEADSWQHVEDEIDKAKAVIESVAQSADDEFLEALSKLAASTPENIEAMKQRAQDAVFILPEIAMVGDCTIINAGPNMGKTLLTLWLLTRRNKKATSHLQIYYINADDSFNGGIEKMEILKDEGIHTLIPNQNGFESADLSKIIKAAIKADACGRMVLILDTLKKFVSTMDKNDARVFNIMVRTFTQAGGTLIALAHTNKSKGADGKSIAEGVGDFHSDFDCAYTVERVEAITEGAARTVRFENFKLRGPNSMKVTFEYDSGEKRSWHRRFQSVKQIGEEEARANADKALADAQLEKDQPIIDYLLEAMAEGAVSHSGLCQNNLGNPVTGSRAAREKVLTRYIGIKWGRSKTVNGGWNFFIEVPKSGNLVKFGI